MPSSEQNRISRVVWPWRSAQTPASKGGLPRQGRALIQTGVMLVIAFLLYRWRPGHFMHWVVLGLAGVVLVGGLFVPPLFHAIERFGQALGRYAAVALTWGLLVPFYYLCFLPVRLCFFLQGKDPMHRAFPTDAPSYWISRPPVRNVEQYRKQH